MPASVLCSVCQTQARLLAVVSETSVMNDYYHCAECKRVWTTPKGASEPIALLQMAREPSVDDGFGRPRLIPA
jgi:hypothetical protein